MVDELLRTAFENGTIELKGQFTLGSNYTFFVSVAHEQQIISAVYKPQKGEQPLWDFPENTLAGREVAAYLVNKALGWDIIPYTIFRENGPYGPGSLQQYIEYNPEYHYFSFKPEDKERLRPVALFDLLTNNADRKGSHVFFETGTKHLYAIDHGLCFNEEDKLRSVIWDFAGEVFSPQLVAGLQGLHTCLQPDAALHKSLLRYLNPIEIATLDQRAEALIAHGEFPYPPKHRRVYPYPPL